MRATNVKRGRSPPLVLPFVRVSLYTTHNCFPTRRTVLLLHPALATVIALEGAVASNFLYLSTRARLSTRPRARFSSFSKKVAGGRIIAVPRDSASRTGFEGGPAPHHHVSPPEIHQFQPQDLLHSNSRRMAAGDLGAGLSRSEFSRGAGL